MSMQHITPLGGLSRLGCALASGGALLRFPALHGTARPALTLPLRIDVQVRARVGMALRAMRLGRAAGASVMAASTPVRVDLRRDDLQVVDPATRGLTAQVVGVHTFRDRPVHGLPLHPVGVLLAALRVRPMVHCPAVPGGRLAVLPDQARRDVAPVFFSPVGPGQEPSSTQRVTRPVAGRDALVPTRRRDSCLLAAPALTQPFGDLTHALIFAGGSDAVTHTSESRSPVRTLSVDELLAPVRTRPAPVVPLGFTNRAASRSIERAA